METSRTFRFFEEPSRAFVNSGDATSLFRYSVQEFLGAIAVKDRPLVFFFYGRLALGRRSNAGFVAVVAWRLFEQRRSVRGDVILRRRRFARGRDHAEELKNLQTREVTVTHLHLNNLDEASTSGMLADILEIDSVVAEPIANLVHSQTRGIRILPCYICENFRSKDFCATMSMPDRGGNWTSI